MKEIAAAQRYARALFLAVRDKKESLPTAQKQLRSVLQLIRSKPALEESLGHAFLSVEKKESALKLAMKSAGPFSPLVGNFLTLLVRKKRIGLLALIAAGFDHTVDDSQGAMKASVRSAAALNEKTKNELEKRLSKMFDKTVVIDVSVDPELLAGMVVKAGDTVIDNTLRSQLRNLKTRLENGD